MSAAVRTLCTQHDADASGGIDKSELVELLHTYGFQLETAFVDQLWERFDTDDSGSLDASEFRALMHILMDRARELDASRVKPVVDTAPDVADSAKSTLHVTVVSASGLPKHDLLGENDPFVVVSINDVASRTDTAYNGGSAPRWGRGGQGERLSFLCTAIPTVVSVRVRTTSTWRIGRLKIAR